MSSCWITLNRACNLRCAWCYSKKDNYRVSANMNEETLRKAIDICAEGKVKKILLIGGEPTISPLFEKALELGAKNGIKMSIITNGIVFDNPDYVDKISKYQIHGVNVSIKCYGNDAYMEVTGVGAYSKTISAIKNLINKGIKTSASIVLTKNNIAHLHDILLDLKETGVKDVVLSFCRYFNTDDKENEEFLSENNPFEMINLFKEKYHEIKYLNSIYKFHLQSGYPLCAFPKDFLEELETDNVLRYLCQLLRRTGIIFDTDGTVMPCNYLYDIQLGKLGMDFNSYSELQALLYNKENTNIYRKLLGVPSERCLKCEMLKKCGGGCVLNWSNFTFDQLFNELKHDE